MLSLARFRRVFATTLVILIMLLLVAPQTGMSQSALAVAPDRLAAPDSWPQVQKDAQHSGYVPQTVVGPYTKLWQRDLPPVSSRVQPIIAEGLIFLPSNDGSLYALSTTDGHTVWSFPTGNALVNAAAYDNGRVFFGSTDHFIYAVHVVSGMLAWKYETGSTVKSAPVVADNKVFMGSSDGYFYAIDQITGTLAWRTDIGAPIYDTAACDNGRVFFGGLNSIGYALNAGTGHVDWSRSIPGQGFRDRWTVAGNGRVFFTPMIQGTHHAPLNGGTQLFRADANPVIYNQPWSTQRQAILNYLAANPYHQPLHVLNQSDGSTTFTPPILYASGGSQSPHSQVVLLPNGNANVIYRRSFGEPAQWGATTNDALFTGELNLTTGDIAPVDTCVTGSGGWAGCGPYKSAITSDESAAMVRSGSVIYQDVARGTYGLDTVNHQRLRTVAVYNPGSGDPYDFSAVVTYTDYIDPPAYSAGWRVNYDDLRSEVSSDGNDLKRPTPIVSDTLYALHYNNLAAVRGTIRSTSTSLQVQRSNPPSTLRLLRRYAARNDGDSFRIPHSALGIQDVRQELETRVQEMVNLGHMAPTRYYLGIGGPGLFYYTTPAETIYTLSAAYPYLSDGLKTQVKQYLTTEIATYPPHQQGHYNPVTGNPTDLIGAKREYFASDPTLSFNMWPGAPVQPEVLYAIWAYANNTNDWTYATNNYTALRAIYTPLRNTNTITNYADLAGVIGFARIAQQLGHTADYNDAAAFLTIGYTQGANFNQFLATAQARFPNAMHQYTTPIFFASRVGYHTAIALHFDRDLGSFLAASAQPMVLSYTQSISKNLPLWWLTAPAYSHGENAYAPPEISWTNFMLHAYVLKDSTDQLLSYLDAPDRKGDLLYLQKLIAVLDTGAPDLSLSDKRASLSTPQFGETITYTIVLRKTGGTLSETIRVTDTIPIGLGYVPNTFTTTLGTIDASNAPTLRWSGMISDTPIVTLTYAVTVTTASSQVISNTAVIAGESIGTLERRATITVNGRTIFLPLIRN